jgi:DNA-binding transcriptional regulator GbsR (MarR family)
MHSKKNASRKPTKVQEANEGVKANILAYMESGKSYTTTDIQKGLGIESNQKASALLRQLKDCNLVDRAEIKGRAYFTKVEG